MLYARLLSFTYPSKSNMPFKITIEFEDELLLNFDPMIFLKPMSFLEG
jgi:hypothetical protein